MKKAILFVGAIILICTSTQAVHAQRGGHGGGWGGGMNHGWEHGGYGFDRGFGREFGRWGYGFGPYGYWGLYGGLYGYPYPAYSAYYYPPTMYFVPPTIAAPEVSYFPVYVPVTPPPSGGLSSTYSGYAGSAMTAPAPSFSANTAPRPVYPGFVPKPSTSNDGYYPDVPPVSK